MFELGRDVHEVGELAVRRRRHRAELDGIYGKYSQVTCVGIIRNHGHPVRENFIIGKLPWPISSDL
jgi:hypothetical protein